MASDREALEQPPRIGDVYLDRTKANEPVPFGRVHVTDVQTIRDSVYVWIEYADSAQITRGKLKLWEFHQRYTLAYQPSARPAPPPPDEPGLEHDASRLSRVGELDPAAAIVAAVTQPPREPAIFDGPAYEPVAAAEGARLKAERDARRGKPAGKPAAVVLPDVAEKDLPF